MKYFVPLLLSIILCISHDGYLFSLSKLSYSHSACSPNCLVSQKERAFSLCLVSTSNTYSHFVRSSFVWSSHAMRTLPLFDFHKQRLLFLRLVSSRNARSPSLWSLYLMRTISLFGPYLFRLLSRRLLYPCFVSLRSTHYLVVWSPCEVLVGPWFKTKNGLGDIFTSCLSEGNLFFFQP